MGLSKKIVKIFVLAAVLVYPLLVFSPYVPQVNAQETTFAKWADPPTAFPGDTVTITIEVPGGSQNLRQDADIMLVIDRSGSMTAPFPPSSRMEAAKDALHAFVAETQEATSDQPGDYVGAVAYSTNITGGARIEYPLSNMTAVNKEALNAEIEGLNANGGTPIGAGLKLAKQELLNEVEPSSESRDGIAKFIVLATDGNHNSPPSPYELGIMDEIKAAGIEIFAIGIGMDVDVVGNFYNCGGCPDPNGDGKTSGAELMKTLVCDSDPDCVKPLVWNTGNPCDINKDDSVFGGVNDVDCPDRYYFANDPSALSEVYVQIAGEIQQGVNYAVADVINGAVFDHIIPATLTVLNVSVNPITNWPHRVFYFWGTPTEPDGFIVQMDPIPEGTTVWIQFSAVVKDLPGVRIGDGQAIDGFVRIAFVLPEDATCNTLQECIDFINESKGRTLIPLGSINIINPLHPWLETTGGDVGSVGNATDGSINNIARDPNIPNLGSVINADYLVIGDYGVHPFFRSLRWSQENYFGGFGGIDLHMGANPVDTLRNTAERKCGGTIPPLIMDQPSTAQLAAAVDNAVTNFGCNAVLYNGSIFNIGPANAASWSAGYSGEPAVVFVDGEFNIKQNMKISEETGLIFVADNTVINTGVTEVDGFLVSRHNFRTSNNLGRGCGYPRFVGDQRLTINGAVHAFGQMCFNRDLSSIANSTANDGTAAEQINFEPKYLFLFKDIIGGSGVIYREVAP